MKTLFLLLFSLSCLCTVSRAQTQTATIKVSGECGTCKKKIEGAALKAGASYASWNVNTKVLTLKYKNGTTSTDKVEKAIAGAGYDTPDYPASEDAYNNLDDCCKYERKPAKAADPGR